MEEIAPPKSLTEQTYDILLNAICAAEFEPGERLNQDNIAARLKVSRQPVNSAISILKANGFVEDTGKRGVVVAQISTDQFNSIYEFRSAVEPFAIRLAHVRKPDDAAALAHDMLSRGWKAVKSGDLSVQIQTDFEFHTMIYDWSGNATIATTMRTNWHHIRRAMGVVVRQGISAETSWQEHQEIIDALLNDDVVSAENVMRRHIEQAQHATATILSQLAKS
ncbi:MAG: DNA-binding GntR family transcriptional regulator [Paracoccaceae bacterium]|jgi:DNA-binding GntR family transcriptional regulator|tara:strand:+ start:251 stop:916 length:666 start_codon:yes stop_codon:yes gene_type:complete